MLPDIKSKTIYRIINDWDRKKFSKLIKEKRIKIGMSRNKLAELLDKGIMQISRYENSKLEDNHLPNVTDLVRLCDILQLEPNELLSFRKVNCWDDPEPGFIYDYIIKDNKIYWICPKCKNNNITYGEFKKKNKAFNESHQCEYCSLIFDNLYKDF